jgi:hypothetical protein
MPEVLAEPFGGTVLVPIPASSEVNAVRSLASKVGGNHMGATYTRPAIETRHPITDPLIGVPASGSQHSAAFRRVAYAPPRIHSREPIRSPLVAVSSPGPTSAAFRSVAYAPPRIEGRAPIS